MLPTKNHARWRAVEGWMQRSEQQRSEKNSVRCETRLLLFKTGCWHIKVPQTAAPSKTRSRCAGSCTKQQWLPAGSHFHAHGARRSGGRSQAARDKS